MHDHWWDSWCIMQICKAAVVDDYGMTLCSKVGWNIRTLMAAEPNQISSIQWGKDRSAAMPKHQCFCTLSSLLVRSFFNTNCPYTSPYSWESPFLPLNCWVIWLPSVMAPTRAHLIAQMLVYRWKSINYTVPSAQRLNMSFILSKRV